MWKFRFLHSQFYVFLNKNHNGDYNYSGHKNLRGCEINVGHANFWTPEFS